MYSTLLWSYLYISKIIFLDYELNIYDKLLANNMVEEKHFTLCWYLYDKKVSHMKDKVCEEIFSKISEYSA